MAFNNFAGVNNDNDDPNGGSGGPGGPSGNIPTLPSFNNAAQQVDDITEIMVNYNERFKNASPALFRDELVQLAVAVLISAAKPNPLLVGPAGVGKTRIVEEIARLIENKSSLIPKQLQGYTIWELPISNLVAGGGIVGEIERRILDVVAYATEPKNKAILFVDEIHLLNSKNETYNKIAQILKPALARGDMHLIGATTAQEARSFDDDPAFARRFSRIVVDELTLEQTTEIVKLASQKLLAHYDHKISLSPHLLDKITSIADENSASTSHRPDNALTLLDRAMGDTLVAHGTLIAQAEKDGDTAYVQQLRSMVPVPLTEKKTKSVAIRLMTGLAKKKIFDMDELKAQLQMLKGQDDVLDKLINALHRDSLGLFPRVRPTAWIFSGPSGVGKTQATKLIAEAVTGQKPIILKMNEYNHSHDISRLIGSGPGYVGSDSNKELPFDSLESNPYRVILLDEIEKAHTDIHQLLLGVLDEGNLQMASGKVIDFSRAIIIATTNAGRDALLDKPQIGFQPTVTKSKMLSREEVTKALKDHFTPEFLGRFSQVVSFHSLSRDVYREICEEFYARERERIINVNANMANTLPQSIDPDDLDALITESYVASQGARPAEQAIRAYIENCTMTTQQSLVTSLPMSLPNNDDNTDENTTDDVTDTNTDK